MNKVDIKTMLTEGLTENTSKLRSVAESLLDDLFRQYDVPEKQRKMVVTSLQEYVNGVYADTYDMALHAGAKR